jgi:hypothetical protein
MNGVLRDATAHGWPVDVTPRSTNQAHRGSQQVQTDRVKGGHPAYTECEFTLYALKMDRLNCLGAEQNQSRYSSVTASASDRLISLIVVTSPPSIRRTG